MKPSGPPTSEIATLEPPRVLHPTQIFASIAHCVNLLLFCNVSDAGTGNICVMWAAAHIQASSCIVRLGQLLSTSSQWCFAA